MSAAGWFGHCPLILCAPPNLIRSITHTCLFHLIKMYHILNLAKSPSFQLWPASLLLGRVGDEHSARIEQGRQDQRLPAYILSNSVALLARKRTWYSDNRFVLEFQLHCITLFLIHVWPLQKSPLSNLWDRESWVKSRIPRGRWASSCKYNHWRVHLFTPGMCA